MSFKKNTATTITFLLVERETGLGVTTGSPTVKVSKDGGALSTITNTGSVTHLENGLWTADLSATEMNADLVSVLATATNAIPQSLIIPTEAKLVSELNDFDPTSDEVDVGSIKGEAVTGVDDLVADVSGLSTFDPASDEVDVGSIKGTAVAGPNDLKANVSGLSTFDASTDGVILSSTPVDANITQVGGSAVSSPGDLKADVSGLSTFDSAADTVRIEPDGVNTTTLSSGAIDDIVAAIAANSYDGVSFTKLMTLLLSFMSGRVTVNDTGGSRVFTFYQRDGSTVIMTLTANEQESFEGQRSSGATITGV